MISDILEKLHKIGLEHLQLCRVMSQVICGIPDKVRHKSCFRSIEDDNIHVFKCRIKKKSVNVLADSLIYEHQIKRNS